MGWGGGYGFCVVVVVGVGVGVVVDVVVLLLDIGQIHSSGSPEIFTLRVNTNINIQCLSCNNLKLKITLTLNGAPYCLTPCSTVNTELDFQQVGLRWSPGHVFGLWGSVSGVVMGSGAGSVV